MHQVMIHPATYDNVCAVVDRAFDLFPKDLQGKNVLIKPNVLRASEADEGIVTHPAVLAAVVDKVATLEPASIIVGDNPGLFSYGANEAAFEQSGLMAASKGNYRNIGLDAVSVPFHSDFMETVNVSRAIIEADIVISLPKFKTHGLTVMTGGIKNSYGFLPGAQLSRLGPGGVQTSYSGPVHHGCGGRHGGQRTGVTGTARHRPDPGIGQRRCAGCGGGQHDGPGSRSAAFPGQCRRGRTGQLADG